MDLYKKEHIPGAFFIFFMLASSFMGIFYLSDSLAELEKPSAQNLLDGKWCAQLEKNFGQAVPVSNPSRDFWSRTEYQVFGEGRKGVVVGSEGWLFTAEEFSCPKHAADNLADNFSYIEGVQKKLAEKGAWLAVSIIPAKSRLYSEHLGVYSLPSCRASLYMQTRQLLTQARIHSGDLLTAMRASPSRDKLFLKADTHWSPMGARVAARTMAEAVASLEGLDLPTTPFSTQIGSVKSRAGDLAKYVPGIPMPDDYYNTYVTGLAVASTDHSQGLFDNTAPSVVLVGTSYDFNPDWNSEGFLKEALKTDVLNVSDEGLGPFVVMDKYLADDAWKESPPRLVIWSIPERYLPMRHGIPD